MARNIGPEDRVFRIIIGLVLAVLAYLGVLPGIATIVMIVLAAYLLITGIFARCLIYKVANIDTSIQEQPYSTTDDRAGL
jgi:flagellar biosynthesis component FlhA